MVVNETEKQKDDLLLTLGLGYLSQFLGQRVNELVLAYGRRKGFSRMRVSYGYVIQHLVESDRPISRTGSELARRMGVTQQAASKSVLELQKMGVVKITRSKDPRAKEVSLTNRGWEMVRSVRKFRAGFETKLRRHLGARRYAETQQALRECLQLLGGVERINSRRVCEPK